MATAQASPHVHRTLAPDASPARIAGVALLGVFATVFLEHGIGASLGGTSLYRTHDPTVLAQFFGHADLATLYWICAGLVLSLIPFALAFRAHVGRPSYAADLAVAFIVVETPLLVAHYGLALALVQVTPLGQPETSLAIFAVWEAVYHPVEWMEIGWMAAIATAAWRTGALPRWNAAWAALVAAGLAFNVVARHLALPEGALLPTYALYSMWMLVTAVVLVSRPVARQVTDAGPSLPASA